MNAFATLALLGVGASEAPMPRESVIGMFLTGVVMSALSLGALPFAARLVRNLFPDSQILRVPWGWQHVALVAFLYVVVAVLVGWIVRPPKDDIVAMLELSAAVFGVLVAVAVTCAAAYGTAGLHAFGLRLTGNVRAIFAGLVAYIAFIPGFLGAAALWNVVLKLFGHQMQKQELLTGFSELEPGQRFLPLLIGVALQPLFEEALFRGLLQPLLVQWLRPMWGVVITSVLFGAMHGLDAFGPIFALSMVLGWIRQRTQRLSASWAMHALHNGGTFYILYAGPKWIDHLQQTGLWP